MLKASGTPIIVGMLTLAAMGSGANLGAATLVTDNFDGYADQAAFVTAWPAVGTSGTLSSAQSSSPSNSVHYAATPATQRNGLNFTESGNPSSTNLIVFSFDFYDSNAATNPYRQYSNLQDTAAPGAYGQLVSMGLNNNQTSAANGGNFYMARILGYTPPDTGGASGSYFKLNSDPALLRTTGWHNLRVEISDVDFKFYVDNSLAETVLQTGTLRSYDVLRLGSGVTSAAEAWFDNVRVEIVPEPSTLALGLIGVAGLFRRCRSQSASR